MQKEKYHSDVLRTRVGREPHLELILIIDVQQP